MKCEAFAVARWHKVAIFALEWERPRTRVHRNRGLTLTSVVTGRSASHHDSQRSPHLAASHPNRGALMARTYAQIQVAIWQDDDFRALPPAAQHLYFLLLTSPKLNLAGVTDWRPNRIATLAGGWTDLGVRTAAEVLIDEDYILVDPRTEEVVVRTFIKHDSILRNPKTAAGMVSAWGSTYSQPIRRCIADEVSKLADGGVKDIVRSTITPLLDYLSDYLSDTQSADEWEEPDQVSDQVRVPPASCIPHPASLIPSSNQSQVLNARVAAETADRGMDRVGDVLALVVNR